MGLLSVNATDRHALQALVRATSTPQVVAQRAGILLRAAEPDAYSDRQVARAMGVHHTTVQTWRSRCIARRNAYPEDCVRHLLDDAPRSWRPLVYGPDERMAMVVLACRPPEAASPWSIRDLTAAIHEQTALRPASSTVWTILDEATVKPHMQAMWLNSHDPAFTTKPRAITDLYRELPMASRLILSLDKKTGMQAKEHLGPHLPVRPG